MFTKFLLRVGPGSPGATTKVYCQRYNNEKSKTQDITTRFRNLYNDRFEASIWQSEHLFLALDEEKIIAMSQGNFPCFVYMMLFAETKAVRDGVINHPKILKITAEIIHETIYNQWGVYDVRINLDEFIRFCVRWTARFKYLN